MFFRLFATLVACLLGFGLAHAADAIEALESFRAISPEQQRAASTFTLSDYQGTPVNLADLQGKVVVVRFWATW